MLTKYQTTSTKSLGDGTLSKMCEWYYTHSLWTHGQLYVNLFMCMYKTSWIAWMTDCLNPLTTNDTYMHCLTLGAYSQLTQSILKIAFALAKRVGKGMVSQFRFQGCQAHGRLDHFSPWGTNMSWCSQGYEHPENGSMKPWLKFPVRTK